MVGGGVPLPPHAVVAIVHVPWHETLAAASDCGYGSRTPTGARSWSARSLHNSRRWSTSS